MSDWHKSPAGNRYKRTHSGAAFSSWQPHEDALLLACQPMPLSERRNGAGKSDMQKLAEKLGRSQVAIRCRRYKLLRGRK